MRQIPIRTDVPLPEQQMPARPQHQQYQNSQQHFQQPTSQHYQHSSPQQHFQQNSQQQQFPDSRNQDERGPTVRHIPIFVEGRDEPILPKDAAPSGMKRGGCQGKAENTTGKRGAQPEEKRQQQQQTSEQQAPQQQTQFQPQPPQKPDTLQQVAEVSICFSILHIIFVFIN